MMGHVGLAVGVLMMVGIHTLNVVVVMVVLLTMLVLVLNVVMVSIDLNRLKDWHAVVRVLVVEVLMHGLLGRSGHLRGHLLGLGGIGVGVLVGVAVTVAVDGLRVVRVAMMLTSAVVASLRVVFLRFVMKRLLVVSVAEIRFPVAGVVISASVLTVGVGGVALVISFVGILRCVMNGHLLDLVVVMLVMVGVGCTDLLGVSMVVSTLGDGIVVAGKSHSEVERLVLGVLVVVGVVLVAMSVLRGHVMVSGVLVVVRVGLVRVTLVVLVGGRVVSLVMGTSGVGVLSTDVTASVGCVGGLVMN